MPAVFKTVAEARNRLLKGFMTADNEYLELCSRMLVYLCDLSAFEKGLESVSKLIWSHYVGLDAATKNKFSRSLAHVALQNGFRVSTKPTEAPHADKLEVTADAPPSGALDIKLVGSYGGFFQLLRDRCFWKDSMDMEHGEYSHALQWLALALKFGQETATFYSELPGYQSKGIPLWSYLADCFPETKAADAELTSSTYRSPQMITKHLIGNPTPIKGHFVSIYLNYVYKHRNLLSYEQTKIGTTKANYGQSSVYALDAARGKNWSPSFEKGKNLQPQVTRLDRDLTDTPGKATKGVGLDVTFHGIPGTLWTGGDWNNISYAFA